VLEKCDIDDYYREKPPLDLDEAHMSMLKNLINSSLK